MNAEKEKGEAASAHFASLRFNKTFDSLKLNRNAQNDRLSTQHNSANPINKMNRVEVEEQTQGPSTEAELTQQVRFMQRFHRKHSARVYNHLSAHYQFDLCGFRQEMTFVLKSQRNFPLEWHAAQMEFMAKADLVRRRQQTGAQFFVDGDGSRDDLSGQMFRVCITAIAPIAKARRIACARPAHPRDLRRRAFMAFVIQPQNEPFDSLLQSCNIKIDQEGNFPAADFQIRQHLRVVNRMDRIHSLHFNHDDIGGKQVETKATLQLYTFVNDWNRSLHLMRNATQPELVRQSVLISGFRFPGSEFSMYGNSCADDLMREFVVLHARTVSRKNIRVNRKTKANSKASLNRSDATNAEAAPPVSFSAFFASLRFNHSATEFRRAAMLSETRLVSPNSFSTL